MRTTKFRTFVWIFLISWTCGLLVASGAQRPAGVGGTAVSDPQKPPAPTSVDASASRKPADANPQEPAVTAKPGLAGPSASQKPEAAASPLSSGAAAPQIPPSANQPLAGAASPQPAGPATSQDAPSAIQQITAKIAAREREEISAIRRYSPIIETYIQKVRNAKDDTWSPNGDQYFIGRADLATLRIESLALQQGSVRHYLGWDHFFGIGAFTPNGFLQMIFPDPEGLNPQDYRFEYVRREFLGEVRTLVFDVKPAGKGRGRFTGRVWVEDEGFTIVRFNGSYAPGRERSLDFDSWRINGGPNLWLPALVYTEQHTGKRAPYDVAVKAQTRLWGYQSDRDRQEQELSQVLVESATPVTDLTQNDNDLSPVQENRAWREQSAGNVLELLERKGLMAPVGDVDKILSTVVNNLEVTNNISIDPEIRCRVLMTSTIESFSIGNTIVLSRGMIDVLPDEATLAAMISREMAHILLHHRTDTRLAFYDRVIGLEGDTSFQHFDLARDRKENAEAAAKATELLRNSPYKTQLHTAEMFIAELQMRSRQIPNLIRPRLGDAILSNSPVRADTEDKQGDTEIVALPLGSRVKFDPWNNHLEILQSAPVAGMTKQDKLPFEITPFLPYLTRESAGHQKNS